MNAFDRALIDAGVGDVNLVRVSSILPAECRRVEPFELPGGALVPAAYSRAGSSQRGEVIAAAVAVAVPEKPSCPGLIMEHHAPAPLEEVSARVRQMALRGMEHRDRAVAEVSVVGAEHTVQRHGAAFAGVVLWKEAAD